jgi:acyl-CoA thioester hydrolase
MPFEHPVSLPYYQFDQQGVVFNMWYLGWFDDAMGAYFASIGFPFDEMIRNGFDVQLVHTELDWSASVRFGDEPVVQVAPLHVGTTSLTLSFAVRVGDDVRATAETVYVVVATDGSGKRGVPELLRAALGHAAG